MAIISLPRRMFLRNAAVACAVAPALQPMAAIAAETRVQVPMAATHDFIIAHDGLTLEYDPTDRKPAHWARYVKDGRILVAYEPQKENGLWSMQSRAPGDGSSSWHRVPALDFPSHVDGRLTAIRFSV